MQDHLKKALNTLREIKPLVLNLTNYVTMDFMANALLALGAAPVMSVCSEEIEELIQISGAVYINIGTLNKESIRRYQQAAEIAQYYKKPVILDPVGAGASRIRTETASMLLPFCTAIKGNASEILSLADTDTEKTLGVESVHSTLQAAATAGSIAQQYQCCVIVSGKTDIVTSGSREEHFSSGSPLMSQITGMGCALGSIIAAFNALPGNCFENSCLATACFGLCGSQAAEKASAPGSFRTAFIDTLYAVA